MKIDTPISMKSQYSIERKAMRILPVDDQEQKYITGDKQNNYLVNISEDGFFEDQNGEYLDGEYNFVLTCEDPPKLLCSSTNLNHSFLSNGKKVLATGTLRIKAGLLTELTNNSGHYRPTDDEMFAVIKALYEASQHSLIRYKSFCSQEPLIYPVAELISASEFSKISPLQQNETISDEGGRKQLVGYDSPVEGDKKQLERRFGRNLDGDLLVKYQQIVDRFKFFQTAQETNSADDEEINCILGQK
ncbi:hypothetical protein [Legionella brunensis]|uniref:hypothetical protein n=1 Tax=Legionella brunensis TaxID=29422 RepID=UPI0010413E03|nr:hypothetical protein [Legionella brunensis]